MPIVTEHLWITLADGTRLAARLWLPDDPAPVPAILEYIPYRKRDGTRGRDEPMHGFFAAQGYAAVRVDMRGSGDSEGLLEDEYLTQEQDDALEMIAWIAAQPWCSGAVGMMGKSWGGFNALQVAARRPPALKAIITVYSTVDRYADDIHYMGGNLLNDNLWWGSIMLAYQSRPPDPALVGSGWRDAWLARLDGMPFWPALWLRRQRRDAYWRHGSVGEDFSAITCPVLAIGGWADSYTNAVPRLLEGLTVPRLGIIGPWAHVYPHVGVPGPAIDFLGEATRWWDHWLKGHDTGIMREPMLRAFIEDWAPPNSTRFESSGRFVGEAAWPKRDPQSAVLHLAPGRLDRRPGGERATLSIRSPLFTGTGCGEWMGTGIPGEAPTDQREDDGRSLVFDTAVLDEPCEILGSPELTLRLASDCAQAQIAVRLCDVAPDGSSRRITYGVLNLSHRDGSAEPRAMAPGAVTEVRLALKVCGYRFPAGHRIRLALSTSYWPLIWPSRDPATLTIYTAGCHLDLPTRSGGDAISLAPPRHGPATPATRLEEAKVMRHTTFDVLTGTAGYTTVGQGGLFGEGVNRWDEIGTSLSHDLERTLTIGTDDPLSARSTIRQTYRMTGDGFAVRIESETTMTSDRDAFTVRGTLTVYEGEQQVRSRSSSERVPRDHL